MPRRSIWKGSFVDAFLLRILFYIKRGGPISGTLGNFWEFSLDVLILLMIHGIIYLVYRALGITCACIMVLGIIRESSLILLLFFTKKRLKRIVFEVSISLSFSLQLFILEQLSVVFYFYFFFLLGVGVLKHFFFKGKSLMIEILYLFLLLSPHLFIDLQWGFNLYVMLFFLCIIKVLFNPVINMDFSYSLKSLFFTLLCLLIYIFCNFNFEEQDFYLQFIFLIQGSLVFYFCFLSERGYELAITSLSYLSSNIYIARLITANNKVVFERYTFIYLIVVFFIFLYLYILSKKKKESLNKIFNETKVQFLLTLLIFLDPLLSSLCIEVNTQYTWVEDWLHYFKSLIGVFGLFILYFDEKEENSVM